MTHRSQQQRQRYRPNTEPALASVIPLPLRRSRRRVAERSPEARLASVSYLLDCGPSWAPGPAVTLCQSDRPWTNDSDRPQSDPWADTQEVIPVRSVGSERFARWRVIGWLVLMAVIVLVGHLFGSEISAVFP